MEITVTKNEFRNLVVSELKDYLEAKMSSEETKVLQFLIKHGANPKEAEKSPKNRLFGSCFCMRFLASPVCVLFASALGGAKAQL